MTKTDEIQKVNVPVKTLMTVLNSLPSKKKMEDRYNPHRPFFIQKRVIMPDISPFSSDETVRVIELQFEWNHEWILKDTTL